MKKIKMFISLLCSTAVLFSALHKTVMAEEYQNEVYSINDGLWEPDYVVDTQNIKNSLSQDDNNTPRLLPNSVDLSTSIYFPPIGNQGEMSSCTGWSTTYYQFTYEVNKFKGVATDNSNIYSPSWTYNYINGGNNQNAFLSDAYNVLRYSGAMKLIDYPHSEFASNYSYNWSSDIQKMTDALSFRATTYHENATSSFDLNDIKTQLANGKVGVVWLNPNGMNLKYTTTGEKIIVRGSTYNAGGHYMTLVGYDDSVTVNVGESNMVGAFKLANSYGTTGIFSYNNGYVWVAYDALNTVSTINNGWESGYSTTRSQIFGDGNPAYFINVNHYKSYIVGKATYITNDPWHTNIYGNSGSSATSERFIPMKNYYSNMFWYQLPDIPDLQYADYRVKVFDYFDSNNPSIGNYLSSQFTTKMTNNTTNNTYRIYLSAMDNKCKLIAPNDTLCGTLANGPYSRTFSMDLAKGRIAHYDSGNITLNDINLLSSYILGAETLSSLQWYLADMNNDSAVDIFDLVLLQQAYNAQSGMTLSMNDYLPEFGCSFNEYIENQLNEKIEDFLYKYESALVAAGIEI